MKSTFSSFLTKLTLTASVASVLTGCDEPDYGTPTPVTESTVGQARILVVNAAPGSQGVTTTFENLPFGTVAPYLGSPVSTYSTANAGQRLFVFNDPANIPATPAAATAAGVAPLTAPRPLAFRMSYAGGTSYTVFLTELPTRAYAYPVTATSNQGGIQTLVLTDNLAAPAVATNAKIRFVNLSPSGTYGIYTATAPLFSAAPTRAYRATSNAPTTPTVTYANFTEVAAGTYDLNVRSSTATGVPILGTQRSTTFAAGKIYTLYVRGVTTANTATPLGISVVQHN